jgi:Fic family protein
MRPPYQITPKILNFVSEISRILGKLDSLTINIPEPKLRKKNRIRTIKATLAIEGNTFTAEQITAILENKKVLGSKKEILEVKNTIALYEEIDFFKPDSTKSFLVAHSKLMKGIIESSGKFRSKNVGVLKGQIVKHVAPKPMMVPELISSLFDWSKKEKELPVLIKSCIVHYEIEFIHPFEDGNGRMGRFWQSVMLTKLNPVFKYVPVESLIEQNQQKYYDSLEKSDKAGDSTPFIEFMLSVILESISEFDSETKGVIATAEDRLIKAKEHFSKTPFSRKEYMELFKSISSATASRDLKDGVNSKALKVSGEKNQTRYRF